MDVQTPALPSDALAAVSRRVSKLEAARAGSAWMVAIVASVIGSVAAALLLAAPRLFARMKGKV